MFCFDVIVKTSSAGLHGKAWADESRARCERDVVLARLRTRPPFADWYPEKKSARYLLVLSGWDSSHNPLATKRQIKILPVEDGRQQ